MELYSIFEELILETVSRNNIIDAIDKKQRCRIYYDPSINRDPSKEKDNNEKGYRNIETYVYGVSKGGNPIIRAWQLNGVTNTDQPGWKTFRVDRIINWRTYPSFYYTPIEQRVTGAPAYNQNGDRSMTTIYNQAKF